MSATGSGGTLIGLAQTLLPGMRSCTAAQLEAFVRAAVVAIPRLSLGEGDSESLGYVIVWNGTPQNGSFTVNPEELQREEDGTICSTVFSGWPEDSVVLPARLIVAAGPELELPMPSADPEDE